jgi:hypothetical protein
MNPTARAVVFLLVILGLAVSLAPSNFSSRDTLTVVMDGSQPPVPPKLVLFDGSQPPVPPKMTQAFAWMLDGSQPPVPPKIATTGVRLDGSQPPVPPKAAVIVVRLLDGSQPPVPPKALPAEA